ncbi:MAG: hypothetical protein LAO56_22080 [Acidobacteriia bacterium]|nr:hypothetical protein [Terriglobia bacterium]
MKAFIQVIAYLVMALSAAGVVLCLGLYFLGPAGIHPLQARETPVLFGGVFVVWFPTVILMNRLTQDFKQKDLWKAALRGCPPWMRVALWVVIGCVFAAFFLPMLSKRNPGDAPQTFVLFPIIFYAVSFCVMYSLVNVEEHDSSRRCLNGHPISPLAKFCEECGAPAAPDSKVSLQI